MKKGERKPNARHRQPEYQCWVGMRYRCNSPNSRLFKYYGGRGIGVCDEWNEDYDAFLRDMGFRPSNKHSIERRDNNGDYCAQNCYWATKKEQGRNRRTTIFIGEQTQKEKAAILGISTTLLRERRREGKSLDAPKAFKHLSDKEVSEIREHVSKFGAPYGTTVKLARKYGVSDSAIYMVLKGKSHVNEPV